MCSYHGPRQSFQVNNAVELFTNEDGDVVYLVAKGKVNFSADREICLGY